MMMMRIRWDFNDFDGFDGWERPRRDGTDNNYAEIEMKENSKKMEKKVK